MQVSQIRNSNQNSTVFFFHFHSTDTQNSGAGLADENAERFAGTSSPPPNSRKTPRRAIPVTLGSVMGGGSSAGVATGDDSPLGGGSSPHTLSRISSRTNSRGSFDIDSGTPLAGAGPAAAVAPPATAAAAVMGTMADGDVQDAADSVLRHTPRSGSRPGSATRFHHHLLQPQPLQQQQQQQQQTPQPPHIAQPRQPTPPRVPGTPSQARRGSDNLSPPPPSLADPPRASSSARSLSASLSSSSGGLLRAAPGRALHPDLDDGECAKAKDKKKANEVKGVVVMCFAQSHSLFELVSPCIS